MSLSDFGKVCLFSGMSGVITLNGNPVVNARLVRTADRDGSKTDETTTDDYGYFEFPAMWERTITKYLPQEFVAAQEIILIHEGVKHEIWSAVKRKPDENAESRGEKIELKCELSNEEQHFWVAGTPIHTRCTWNIEPDQPFEGSPFEDE